MLGSNVTCNAQLDLFSIPPEIVSADILAQKLNVTPRQIQNLCRDGFVQKHSHGSYLLEESLSRVKLRREALDRERRNKEAAREKASREASECLSKKTQEKRKLLASARIAITSKIVRPNSKELAAHLECSRPIALDILNAIEAEGTIGRTGVGWVLAGCDLVCSSDIEKALGIQKHTVRAMTKRGYLESPSRGIYVIPKDIQKTYQDYLTACYELKVQSVMAIAKTRKKDVVGTHYMCGTCNTLKEIKTEYYWRKRALDRYPSLHMCKACKKKRVVRQRNEKGFEKEFQAEYGFSSMAVMRWAEAHGYGWKANVFTIEGYSLHRARRKLVKCLRRLKDKLNIKPVVVDQDKIWEYYNSFGRLTEHQAWRDWQQNSTFIWWLERGLEPPSYCYASINLYNSYKYRKKYEDPAFVLMERTRQRFRKKTRGKMHRRIENDVYNAMRGKGGKALVELLGYTAQELLDWICSQFTDGMTLELIGKIHIDHIVPCAAFDMSKEESVKACWSLLNLQPLWDKDNLAKSCKAPKHVDPAYIELLKSKAPEAISYLERVGSYA